jgi:UDP-N-acetylmuramate dehydrogenase
MNTLSKSTPNSLPMTALSDVFGARLQKDVSLARYTTARVGGPAQALVEVENGRDLVETASHLWEMGVPFIILGSGSNILVSDAGVAEVVVLNNARQIRFEEQNEAVTVWAESGASLGLVARQAAVRGLSGLEWAAGIPGTVGGAVVGNAGVHGSDMASCVVMAEILHPLDTDGQIKQSILREEWPVEKLAYAYRTSILKRESGKVVLACRFRLACSTPEAVRAAQGKYAEKRKRTQPPGASMGSMFKNPPGDYAGRLIEACGLKGTRVGDAEISSLHANFFINRGQATSVDFYNLIQTVRLRVAEKFNVNLELEIELIGRWDTNG